MPTTSQPRQRKIRVFISSTFRDMQEEREELVKQIFPQLRRLCEGRGVTWGEVDLRWGVPDEAKAEGRVLPLCLTEIERCRPYFIGLLGERYGWVPDEIPEDLLAAQPWLNEHRKESVTALEILHGVVRNPEMSSHAFFYFRDPGYAASREGFTDEDTGRRAQLRALKEEIRKSGFPVAENFTVPKQLGEWVLRDLTAVIETLYPEASVPDPLDRAAADHEAHSASRRRIYIGRPEYFERLDAHAEGEGPPLVVTGESGGGKSALLANWTSQWSEQNPETPVIVHFIGSAPDSADWMAMLRRLMGEFQRRFSIQVEIPDEAHGLRMAFADALHQAAARGRVVLVLDALNQIEDRDGAPDLVWLPPIIPAKVRLVVSTLPGRPLDDVQKRGWPLLMVESLRLAERETLIEVYLKQFAKQLSGDQRRRIAAAPQSANGLYLTTLLNELRLFGSHEELDDRIAWYLQAANPFELYGKVIQRWERDYEARGSETEDLVGESLSHLWAARRGLSETELLELLGTEGSRLPRAMWSPLLLAARDALVDRGGLLTFAHEFFREAVREAYVPTPAHQLVAHRTLADYFHSQPQGPRKLDELPWQLAQAHEWNKLCALLTDMHEFSAIWNRDSRDPMAYWTQIERHTAFRLDDAYRTVLEGAIGEAELCYPLVLLFQHTGKSKSALELCKRLEGTLRESKDDVRLLRVMGQTALALGQLGDKPNALEAHRVCEILARRLGDNFGVGLALGNQGWLLQDSGKYAHAMPLLKEQERIARELGDDSLLVLSLGNQALILAEFGDLDGALDLQKETERIARSIGSASALMISLHNQATSYSRADRYDEAKTLFLTVEKLARELGEANTLSSCLWNIAQIQKAAGEFEPALASCREATQICRRMGNVFNTALYLGFEAEIHFLMGDLDSMIRLLQEQEGLCRQLDDPVQLVSCLITSGMVHVLKKQTKQAAPFVFEAQKLVLQHGLDDLMQHVDALLEAIGVRVSYYRG